jgi:peroxiredoxin
MKANVLYLILTIACMATMAPYQVNGQAVGSPAPDFTLSTDAGTSFNMASQNGKVVFIFFFGYDCPHCLANGNNTETGIYDVYKVFSDFVAIGIDTWNGNEAGVESFKSSTEVTYPLCYEGSELEELYSTSYDRIVVVDQEGIIQYKSTANATSGVVAAASKVISSLLSITSVEDVDQGDDFALSIHPNPATDQIQIKPPVQSEETATISILNTTGQVVAIKEIRQTSADEAVSMSVGFLPAGLYFLQYQTEGKVETAKLVVERD